MPGRQHQLCPALCRESPAVPRASESCRELAGAAPGHQLVAGAMWPQETPREVLPDPRQLAQLEGADLDACALLSVSRRVPGAARCGLEALSSWATFYPCSLPWQGKASPLGLFLLLWQLSLMLLPAGPFPNPAAAPQLRAPLGSAPAQSFGPRDRLGEQSGFLLPVLGTLLGAPAPCPPKASAQPRLGGRAAPPWQWGSPSCHLAPCAPAPAGQEQLLHYL